MIICFSGCGNTRQVARLLAGHLGEADIADLRGDLLLGREPLTVPGGTRRVVWMFPVYSWGVAPAMADFIDRLPAGTFPSDTVHYAVMTCGDEVGMTHRSFRRLLAGKGWTVRSTYSVTMPDVYVLLPGFNVDDPDELHAKLDAMPPRVQAVAESITADGPGVDDVHIGPLPRIKSAIYPLFRRLDIKPKKFHATDACVSCGRCAKVCPYNNIVVDDAGPHWGPACTLCLGCYNCCPQHAVQYGRRSRGKGQYFNTAGRPSKK